MYIDNLTKVSAAQAVAASAVSTNSIDLGVTGVLGFGGTAFGGATPPNRDISTGEPMVFGVNVNVAASLTSCTFEVVNTTDAALTAGLVSLVTVSKLNADLTAGALFAVPIPNAPSAAGWLRFLGMRYVPTGGAATITVSSWLTSHSMFSVLAKAYAKGFDVA